MPIPQTPAVDRSLLRDDVYGRLRDAIVDGTFAPGEQLRDSDLASWLGVSRTPVREALLRLGQGGLVVSHPGRSTIVSTLDLSAVRDARGVVAAMHELAVRESVADLTAGDIAAMRDANRRFASAIDHGDVEAALRADDELHAVPVRAAGNRALAAVLDQFTPVVRRAERLRFASVDGRASAARHDQLIDLAEAMDVDGAAMVAFDTWHSLPSVPADGDAPASGPGTAA
jgi:DNA-binding GntR family transcriptional regulator